MSARERVHGLVRRGAAVVREDAQAAVEADRVVLHGLRFVVEVVAVLGHVLRALCYFMAAAVMETVRTGEDPVFDESYDVTMRLSWLGPGWEHNRQTAFEMRLAAVFCVVAGFVFYETFVYFPLTPVERGLLWATCGTLVVEPAYVRLYLSHVDGVRSEREVSRINDWPFW